ncbi:MULTISPECIES: hypothetical protein [Sorangium]
MDESARTWRNRVARWHKSGVRADLRYMQWVMDAVAGAVLEEIGGKPAID